MMEMAVQRSSQGGRGTLVTGPPRAGIARIAQAARHESSPTSPHLARADGGRS
jgi:hypothetical protein